MDGLIPSSSSFSGDVDFLIILIAVIVGFWFFVAEGVFFWLIFRFRRKPGVRGEYVTGEKKSETKWISWPHYIIMACDVVIILFAVKVWVDIKQTLPPPDETIRVVGQQWAWTFVHPGPDGRLDSDDDITLIDELHVQTGRTYHFQLESTDVLHSFSVPVFRLKQDAVPGRQITGWFRPIQPGVHDVQCAEMCGFGHGAMAARIHIEGPAEHAEWLSRVSRQQQLADASR